MKNNVKNALNALGLLAFMGLAWATSKERAMEPIKMDLTINADSTAFLLKNLEEKVFTNGNIVVARLTDTTRRDTVFALTFIKNSVTINAKESIIIPFDNLVGTNRANKLDTFSKRFKPQRFTYSVLLPKQVDGLFSFNF